MLRRLLRFDTTNPPGNERECLLYAQSVLRAGGIESQLYGKDDARPNLVARVTGSGRAPALLLYGHVDVVTTANQAWSHPPFGGEEASGLIWGRGALDMKSQTAAEVAAAISLARSGWRPARGRLLVVCVVDEETGGAEGAQWLTAAHPDKVRCDFLLNEGGGGILEYRGRRLYCVGCAEKGVFRFRLLTAGVAAHASMPRLGDNALLKMAPLLDRLGARQPGYDLGAEARAFLEAIGELGDGDAAAALARVRAAEPRLAPLLEPMMGVSLAPTRIQASAKINVIPSEASLQVDCRVPPGLGADDALRRIREVLGDDGYRLEFTEQVVGNRSPLDSPLKGFIEEWIAGEDADALCVPVVLPGFTDSRTFRDAFPDCAAYGFFPHRHANRYETDPLIHGADERIDVRDLGFAARFFRDVAERMLE